MSKYNYAFSDFPFPDAAIDFPHHSDMAAYIDNYVQHFELYNYIQYRTKLLQATRFLSMSMDNSQLVFREDNS